jgi:hypothetical protein
MYFEAQLQAQSKTSHVTNFGKEKSGYLTIQKKHFQHDVGNTVLYSPPF